MEASKKKVGFFKPSVFNIYVDRIEYMVVDGKVLNAADAKAFVKKFREEKSVDQKVKAVNIFTDKYNYRVGFANGKFLYEKACENASIKDGEILQPTVVNERRRVIAVENGSIVMTMSKEYFDRIAGKYAMAAQDEDEDYFYDTVSKDRVVTAYPIDFLFNDATADFAVVKGKNEDGSESYNLYYGEVDKQYTILYKGNGTLKEAEASLAKFVREL